MKTTIKILAAALLMLPLFACAHVSPTAVSVATGDVGGRIGAVIDNLKAARPHADQYGQGHIDSGISNATTIQQKDLPTLQKGAADYATEHAENVKLKSQFWSPRQIAYWHIFLISITCIVVLMGVLKAFSEEPIVDGILKILTAICTGGLSVARDIIAWFVGKGVQAADAISKMHAASQTLHAVAQSTKSAPAGVVIDGQPVIGIPVSVPPAGAGTKEQPLAQ